MAYKESNSAFFSWEGTINRKDYIINMLIMIVISVALPFINFEVLVPQKILYGILMFLVQFLQFVLVFSMLSVIYRRIADFSSNYSVKRQEILRKSFIVIFVLPVVYFAILRYFLDFLQGFMGILDIIFLFVFAPVCLIISIVLAFIKGKN